jgi:hypothetical protein
MKQGKSPVNVPEWKYGPNNCTAAQQHYLEVMSEIGAKLHSMKVKDRQEWVKKWLTNAIQLLDRLEKQELLSMATDTSHQRVWLNVFKEWGTYATQ